MFEYLRQKLIELDVFEEATYFIGLPPKAIGRGKLSKSFKVDRIQIKSSKYYNWFIEKIGSEVMSGEKFAH